MRESIKDYNTILIFHLEVPLRLGGFARVKNEIIGGVNNANNNYLFSYNYVCPAHFR